MCEWWQHHTESVPLGRILIIRSVFLASTSFPCLGQVGAIFKNGVKGDGAGGGFGSVEKPWKPMRWVRFFACTGGCQSVEAAYCHRGGASVKVTNVCEVCEALRCTCIAVE